VKRNAHKTFVGNIQNVTMDNNDLGVKRNAQRKKDKNTSDLY
jgi:hypothetical protein